MINLDMFEADKIELERRAKINDNHQKIKQAHKDELLTDKTMFHVSTKEVRRVL